jgi:hypothetical protein
MIETYKRLPISPPGQPSFRSAVPNLARDQFIFKSAYFPHQVNKRVEEYLKDMNGLNSIG